VDVERHQVARLDVPQVAPVAFALGPGNPAVDALESVLLVLRHLVEDPALLTGPRDLGQALAKLAPTADLVFRFREISAGSNRPVDEPFVVICHGPCKLETGAAPRGQ